MDSHFEASIGIAGIVAGDSNYIFFVATKDLPGLRNY